MPSDPTTGSIAYLIAAFDMLNVAHLNLVDQVRSQCDHLVVGVLSDAEVEALNDQAPVFPLEERITIVSHLRDVDEVMAHSASWVAEHPGVRVFALTQRNDVHVDEVISASEMPASEVLRGAVTLAYPAGHVGAHDTSTTTTPSTTTPTTTPTTHTMGDAQ